MRRSHGSSCAFIFLVVSVYSALPGLELTSCAPVARLLHLPEPQSPLL